MVESGTRERVQSVREQSAIGGLMFGRDAVGMWRRVSMALSIVATVVLYLFFYQAKGWSPPSQVALDYSTYVGWALQGYVFVQAMILIFTASSQGRGEIIMDIVTSALPVILILFVLKDHYAIGGFSAEQVRYAKTALGAMTTDFALDLGVGMLSVSRTMNVG